jgi:cobalt-zinc-cadmium efflux system membrane fusion protein
LTSVSYSLIKEICHVKETVKGYLYIGIVLMACALIAPACWQGSPAPEELAPDEEDDEVVIRMTPEQIIATQLDIQPTRPKNLQVVRSFPARIILNGNRYAQVTTEATGIAREVRKDLGDVVHAGEVLAILESRDIAEAKANYLAARRRETLAKATLAREHQLQQRQVSAKVDFLTAENDAEQATIERELSEQKLLAIGLTEAQIAELPQTRSTDLRLYALLAPFEGTVVERDISPGELIAAGSEPYVIADLSTVWVDIGVHPQDIDKIHKGQTIRVSSPTHDLTGVATVIYLSPLVDGETRAARAIAQIDNPQGLWRPGTYVQAAVQTDTKAAAVTVPKGSIQRIDGDEVVFVQAEDGLKLQVVETGLADDDDVEIVQGLDPADCCATQNTFVLKSELLKSDEDD